MLKAILHLTSRLRTSILSRAFWIRFGWLAAIVTGTCETVRLLLITVEDIGYLFGWLIGASKSPVSSVTLPLIFGLLGTAIYASIKRISQSTECYLEIRQMKSTSDISDDQLRAMVRESKLSLAIRAAMVVLLLFCTDRFVWQTRRGIHFGQEVKDLAEIKSAEGKAKP